MDDFLDAIGKLSPTIGTMLGGPFGALIGQGVAALTGAITGTTDPVAQVAALQADPSKVQALEVQTQTLHLQALQAHVADTASARQQTTALAQVHSPIAYGSVVVSLCIIVGFAIAVIMMFNLAGTGKVTDPSLMTILTSVISIFGTLTTMVGNYWLGSSAGSAAKTNILAATQGLQMTNKKQGTK